MGNKKNEQGYALLIVLFLVVFIMIVMAVFMRGSISNAKQEQKVDQNHLSVVAAEMGVDYYSTLFTNKFLEVRDKIWSDNYILFQNEKNKIEAKQGLTDLARKQEIVNKAFFFRNEVAKEIMSNLENIDTIPPEGVNYIEDGGGFGFSITPEDQEGNKYIVVRGRISGSYLGGKSTDLEKELMFLIPPLIKEYTGGNPESEVENFFTIPSVEDVGEIKRFEITNPSDENNPKELYLKPNVSIQTNKDFLVGKIDSNTGYLKISTTGNFHSSVNEASIFNNYNVSIQTNGFFEAGKIQGNIGPLEISAIGNFLSRVGDASIFRNYNVSIHTNGNFEAGKIQGNTGYINIDSTGNFLSRVGDGSIFDNKNVSILTNKSFTAGKIQKNGGYLKINASGNFLSTAIDGSVSENNNVSILTNGSFTAGKIQSNIGDLKISANKDFYSTNLYGNLNGNVSIQTNGNFVTGQIQDNKGPLTIKIAKNFKSTEIYSNTGPIKILALENFDATKIQLTNNSYICVGGNFTVKDYSTIDGTSNLFMMLGKEVLGNLQNKDRVKYLSKDEWENRCGVKLPKDIDSQPGWVNPIVNVEYLK